MVLINFKCKNCKTIDNFELKIKEYKEGIIHFNEEHYCKNCSLNGDIGELELIKKGQQQISIFFLKLNNGGK